MEIKFKLREAGRLTGEATTEILTNRIAEWFGKGQELFRAGDDFTLRILDCNMPIIKFQKALSDLVIVFDDFYEITLEHCGVE